MQLTDVPSWVEGTARARLVATTRRVYPLVSAPHLVGMAIVLGSIAPVDLRLLGLLGPPLDQGLPTLVTLALLGFGRAVATGALLASARMADDAGNPPFPAKTLILAAAGANAVGLRLMSGRRRLPGMVGRAAGAASLSLRTAAPFAGRWIAFA